MLTVPAQIFYTTKADCCKDIIGGEAVIGMASIKCRGLMDVEITAENVGQNYRGTAEAGGKLDLGKGFRGKTEIPPGG